MTESSQAHQDYLQCLMKAAADAGATESERSALRKMLETAELEMMDRRIVTIPADAWDAFEAWAARPAQAIPALQELAGTVPTWRR